METAKMKKDYKRLRVSAEVNSHCSKWPILVAYGIIKIILSDATAI
jgi:hypothetical protein